MDNICHCITATLESFCGNSTVKSCCLVGLHSANGCQCLLKCRWVIMNWQVLNCWLWQIRWVLTISLLIRELKYNSCHSTRRSFRRSVVSHLDLDPGIPIFPREIMDYFPGGGVVAFESANLSSSIWFVEPCHFISFIRHVEARIEFSSKFPWTV